MLDAAPEARRPWLATEYIPAPSLGELVARGGPVDAVTVAWLAAECATALTALHAGGVVHRDLKPQNILLQADGVKVIDFGISHATDLTRTRLTLGTLAYIAPEQARDEPATSAGDVYALGATLCTLATGRAPYPDIGDPIRLLGLVVRGAVDTTGVPEPLLGLVSALSASPAVLITLHDRLARRQYRSLRRRGTNRSQPGRVASASRSSSVEYPVRREISRGL